MTESFPHELLEDSQELSSFRGWSEDVYRLAQGDEMNRASKLGEEISRASETLLTERAYNAVKKREDTNFKRQSSDDQLFPFYRAILLD